MTCLTISMISSLTLAEILPQGVLTFCMFVTVVCSHLTLINILKKQNNRISIRNHKFYHTHKFTGPHIIMVLLDMCCCFLQTNPADSYIVCKNCYRNIVVIVIVVVRCSYAFRLYFSLTEKI